MATAEHTELYHQIHNVLTGYGIQVSAIRAERVHQDSLMVYLNGKRARVTVATKTFSAEDHHHKHVRWSVKKAIPDEPLFVLIVCVPETEICFYVLPRAELRKIMQETSRGAAGLWKDSGATRKILFVPHPARESSTFYPFLNADTLIA